MKTTAKVIAIAVALLASAALGIAEARPGGFGPGYGPGMMWQNADNATGFGPGFGRGGRGGRGGFGPGACANLEPITAEQAQATINEYVAANLKGYEIIDIQPFQMPRGTMYNANVKDAAGNEFSLHLNMRGFVVGPFPVQTIK